MTTEDRSTHHSKREFSALQDFLRGYLHEDAESEYGSASGAAKAFRGDADHLQLEKLRKEWSEFLQLHTTLASVNKEVQRLGGAWRFEAMDEVLAMVKSFGE